MIANFVSTKALGTGLLLIFGMVLLKRKKNKNLLSAVKAFLVAPDQSVYTGVLTACTKLKSDFVCAVKK